MSSKSILIILSYTVSKLVHFETQCTGCDVSGKAMCGGECRNAERRRAECRKEINIGKPTARQ